MQVLVKVGNALQPATTFISMWSYLSNRGADITHYELDPLESDDDKIVVRFRPVDDPDFIVDNDPYLIDGVDYLLVNWGESEFSLIPADELTAYMWTIYQRSEDRPTRFVCTGEIFPEEPQVIRGADA